MSEPARGFGLSSLLKDRPTLALLFLAFALRFFYNFALHGAERLPFQFVIDEREYFGAAHVLFEGRGFSFFDTAMWLRPPLFVAFLAPFAGWFGVNAAPFLLAQSALSAGGLIPLGWLGGRLGGLASARLAVVLGAFYLPFTLFAGLYLSETLFLLLFLGALAVLILAVERGRSMVGWSAVAGALLGLATLTRSTTLAFVPLAAIWLVVSPPATTARRERLKGAVVLCVALGIVLAPWTVRNYAAYGRFVAVDTTSGYNLWLGSVGVRDEARLQADLAPLPGPVARQDFALARAFENLSADPPGFVGKGLKESVDLWRPLFSAEERQVSGYTLGRVPAWHLTALLALDDLLYLVIVLSAIVWLAFSPSTPLKTLSLLWVLLWMLMAFVFFAVTRFRLPIVAVLIPWSARGLLLGRNDWSALEERVRTVRAIAASSLALLALAIIIPSIAFGPTGLGIAKWYAQEPFRTADALLQRGEASNALREYMRADATLADTRYGLASAYLQQGDVNAALGQLRSTEPPDRFEPFIIRGEVARRTGDLEAARRQFTARPVNLAGDEALRWAWAHIKPAPVSSVHVGTGLDLGYVRGFESVETDSAGRAYRWSTEGAEIRGLQPTPSATSVTITFSGWRPEGVKRPEVAVTTAGSVSTGVISIGAEGSDFGDYDFAAVGSSPGTGAIGIRMKVEPYVPGGSDPRLLGVRVSTVTVKK